MLGKPVVRDFEAAAMLPGKLRSYVFVHAIVSIFYNL